MDFFVDVRTMYTLWSYGSKYFDSDKPNGAAKRCYFVKEYSETKMWMDIHVVQIKLHVSDHQWATWRSQHGGGIYHGIFSVEKSAKSLCITVAVEIIQPKEPVSKTEGPHSSINPSRE